MTRLRVLYILHHFPQISETYIRSEIEALVDEFDLRIVSLSHADCAYKNHAPYQQTDDPAAIHQIIEEFRPDILHGHWLQQTRILAHFAGCFDAARSRPGIPFTVRSHSFDVLEQEGRFIHEAAGLVNCQLCLGILAFPFARPYLENGGVHPEKIHDCYPVVNYRRFYDASPNGSAVMNVGACLPKKQMQDYLELATAHPQRRFDLYALGYQTPEMTRLNAAKGNPLRIVPPVEPEEMRAEYKRHEWLVYTASRKMNSVGWPMAVAEAQAAGVGVCLPNIRPDLRDYVGDAGFLYNSLDEVDRLLRQPYPPEMRQRGFEQAKKSDINEHKKVLTNLWRQAVSPRSGRREGAGVASGVPPWGAGQTVLEKRQRLRVSGQELASVVPARETLILVDEDALRSDIAPQRRTLPFLERNGQYWGPPSDDATAIDELERLRHAGAGFLAFAWPAFWWMSHYTGFYAHVRGRYPCLVENERLVVFDLRLAEPDSIDSGPMTCSANAVSHSMPRGAR